MLKRLGLVSIVAGALFAQQNIEEDFLTTLNEVSEIATATKLNIDKTPSTVTVLKRDFIEKTGAKTFYDLLCYIPGIEVSMTPSGKRQIIIRGVKNSYRDKIKFLINGIEVTNNFYTNQFYYYNFPADLIKRIEFTKTPDSVRYGSNAFLGVINIVTLDQEDNNQATIYTTDKSNNQITLFQKLSFNETKISIDAYRSYSKPNILSPATLRIDLVTHAVSRFRDSIPAHTLEKNSGFGLKASKNEWSFLYRYQYYKKGNFYGISRVTPLQKDRYVHLQHQYGAVEYAKFLNPFWKLEAALGVKSYIWNGEFRAFPYDLQPTDNPERDLIFGAFFHEMEYFAKSDVKYLGDKHQLQIHLNLSYAKPKKSYYLQYVPLLNNYAKLPGPIKSGIHRTIIGLGVEDLYSFTDNLTLTVGARVDHYNSFGYKTSFKGGFVYNIDDKNTVKFLHNHAFRAPSWIELYANTAAEFNGDESLKPEEIRLSELQYLTSFTQKDKLKFNLYIGKTLNTIDRYVDESGLRRYKNLGTFKIKGFEASYTYLWPSALLQLRYAKNFDDRKYKRSPLDLPKYLGIRKDIFNANFDFDIGTLHSHTFFKWGSSIETPPKAPDLESCYTINQIFTIQLDAMEWQFGVYNLTDEKNYYFDGPSDIIAGRYMFVPESGEIPAGGRKIFFRIRKEF